MFSQYQINLALVGDCDGETPAGQAITQALQLAGKAIGVEVAYDWMSPELITDEACLYNYDGIWCAPSKACSAVDGALRAIRFARMQGIPFLGTGCGFQLALLEYARNVVAPEQACTPMQVADAAFERSVQVLCGSQIEQWHGVRNITEQGLKRYGLNDALIDPLKSRALQAESGAVRAIELPEHAFFIATSFQPERAALHGYVPPLVAGLVGACAVQVLHDAQLKIAV